MAKKFIDRYEVYGDDPSARVYDDINYYGLCIGDVITNDDIMEMKDGLEKGWFIKL